MEARAVRPRGPRGGGSKRMVRAGVWKLTVSAGRYADGSVRRLHRTVHVRGDVEATIDWLFGRMREAGLSGSRMNAARNLYAPMFRWARRRGIVARNPMAEFQLPTSLHVARERLPAPALRRVFALH